MCVCVCVSRVIDPLNLEGKHAFSLPHIYLCPLITTVSTGDRDYVQLNLCYKRIPNDALPWGWKPQINMYNKIKSDDFASHVLSTSVSVSEEGFVSSAECDYVGLPLLFL